jgi:predicted nucleic acid-binding protein
VIPVTHGDMWDMTSEMEAFELRPRDALHLAVMRRLGERSIVSEDLHFDKARVRRIPIRAFAKSI